MAITEAREAAEHLFTVAQDGILVVNDQGIIQQANPATEWFFGVNPSELRGNHLNKWLTALVYYPDQWTKRSEQTLMILEHRLKPKSNYLSIEVIKKYGDLPLVECYAGQLNQVFMNFLANAINALEEAVENGDSAVEKAALSPPQIHIHTKLTSENQVVISIVDNGLGIPENLQKQLFKTFFTTKPVGKGTGLGLSISYQIVTQKHQGELQCISALGEGTEFVIVIPLNQQIT
ncbi:sensor histidine kinase [Nostoc sp.]|uniref:sensor histidine kinase n=1 Tax=Nostoc sp. TaxID=1180 RepID=UPI002FFB4755